MAAADAAVPVVAERDSTRNAGDVVARADVDAAVPVVAERDSTRNAGDVARADVVVK